MSVKCVRIEADNEIDKLLMATFTHSLRSGYVEVGEEKICLPVLYQPIADRIENFEIRDTDVIIATYPKAGTTWMQELIWMILNDMDKVEGKKFFMERTPFIELECIHDFQKLMAMDPTASCPPCIADSINYAANCKSNPRFMKTHLPWSVLPKQIRDGTRTPKIVCVIRNPKDACVSYYHHCALLEGYHGDFNAFQKLFLAERMTYGSYWKHVLGFWERRQQSNILLIRYEEMKKDLISVIKRVAAFLGKKLDEATTADLVDYLSFENMKQNPGMQVNAVSSMLSSHIEVKSGEFLRSGTVGSYKADMTTDMINAFDKWTLENTRGTGLKFDL